MGFRVGKKVGDFYISTGKSGTRISKKVGDFNVSYWKSNKKAALTTESTIAIELTPVANYVLLNTLFFAISFLTVTWLFSSMILSYIVAYVIYAIIHTCLIVENWQEDKFFLFLSFLYPIYIVFSLVGMLYWTLLLTLGFFIS